MIAAHRSLASALATIPAPLQTVVSAVGVSILTDTQMGALRWRSWGDSQPFPVTVHDAGDLVAAAADVAVVS